MKVDRFVKALEAEFFSGIPDSQLKALCNYLMSVYGVDGKHHIIAANEGNCTALAAGYHLATGMVPVIYLQNSGEGNIINPVASLMNDKVYGIPCIFIVGWRGEPGVHDEPQHIYQGSVTIEILECMSIATYIISGDTTEEEVIEKMKEFKTFLAKGKQVAFVVCKDALQYEGKVEYSNDNTMSREDVIKHITEVSGDDIIISTTGKASRELFEIRKSNGQTHCYDFLTVGSMGHSSSIALGIALQKSEKKIWIIDGDGAMLMHMGSMAVIGANAPKNIVHVIINNAAHESVGGQPTVTGKINIVEIAKGCGYVNTASASTSSELENALLGAKYRDELSLIEVKCSLEARPDLGRPTTTAKENKESFMEYISK